MSEHNGKALAIIETVTQALMDVRTIDDAVNIRDQLAALTYRLRLCRAELKAQNAAAEAKIWSERLLGQMLIDQFPHGGDRRSVSRSRGQTLKDLELSKSDSAKLRKIAQLDYGDLVAYIHTINETQKELTSIGVVKEYDRLHREPEEGEEVPKEVKPEEPPEDEEVRPEFWKSAATCRDEVRRAKRKLSDIKTVLSGLVESPYQPLLKKAAHGDKAVCLAWDGTENERNGVLGAVMVSKVYTCPAIDSLTKLVTGLELLLSRECAE